MPAESPLPSDNVTNISDHPRFRAVKPPTQVKEFTRQKESGMPQVRRVEPSVFSPRTNLNSSLGYGEDLWTATLWSWLKKVPARVRGYFSPYA